MCFLEKNMLEIHLEYIMKATDTVKEELRRKTLKMSQVRLEIHKFKVSTFWMSIKLTDSRRRRPAGAKYVLFDNFCPEMILPDIKKHKKC